LQPYKTNIVRNNYFEFTTSDGTVYLCYFLSYSEYFKNYGEIAGNIFSFNVDIVRGRKTGISSDERVGRTIIEIVKGFLSGLENAVVYVCDTSDGRELLRKRKFDQWFRKYDDGTIIKVNGHIAVPNFNIYNAILIHKENQKKNKFIEAFNDLNESGNK
jgi:hypothetical protein